MDDTELTVTEQQAQPEPQTNSPTRAPWAVIQIRDLRQFLQDNALRVIRSSVVFPAGAEALTAEVVPS